jgi:hypothetical protein
MLVFLTLGAAGLLVYLLLSGKGSTILRVAVLAALVILAVGWFVAALIPMGLRKGKGELSLGQDWVSARGEVQVKDPDDEAGKQPKD